MAVGTLMLPFFQDQQLMDKTEISRAKFVMVQLRIQI